MFIPVTMDEVRRRGWKALDVILVSGDTYTDNSYNGTAVIGHWLIDHGFRVGMVAQPRLDVPDDITRLGEPELFWSVSAGCVDSMVANYTSTNKRRKDDDFTPGGINDRRPDRACIAYTNLIKKFAKGKPIILGGIEASLRRIVHYDMWSDSIRRSVLLDSKADA
ncbi:MAG: YgiQ family radical SAM protein, partial [Candidatus Methanomethylophilaceae archaeon]|nr:YgiQ family radical SAM protein [Candidatus Methanomethylophilaceae archaeon]